MTLSGWGCPHDDNGNCTKRGEPCEPGGKGCVLEERMGRPERPTTKKESGK